MSFPEHTEIDGAQLKIWAPSRSDDSGYVISDEGGWLSGVYECRDSAIAGFRLSRSDSGYDRIAALSSLVHKKEKRKTITLSDISLEENRWQANFRVIS